MIGRCILNDLKYFVPVINTAIDVMHSEYLGCFKNFFRYWFEFGSSKEYSMKRYLPQFNVRLKLIRPTQYVSQAPRNLEDFNLWRAHEFMNFFLYFAIPIFYKIMPDRYFKNILLLVIVFENILCKSIVKTKIPTLKQMLNKFLNELDELYDEHIFVSGIHELTHLIDGIVLFGHPNSLNLMQFEELNRTITRSIKGQDLVGDEYIRNVNLAKNLNYHINSSPEFLLDNCNQDLLSFIKRNSNIKSSNLKRNGEKFVISLGKRYEINVLDLTLYENNVLNEFDLNVNEIEFFESLKLNNILYNTIRNLSKFNNSCISFAEKIGIIFFILRKHQNIYFIVRELKFLKNDFVDSDFINNESNFSFYRLSYDFFIVEQLHFNRLQKSFYFLFEDETYLATKFTSNHLFS